MTDDTMDDSLRRDVSTMPLTLVLIKER